MLSFRTMSTICGSNTSCTYSAFDTNGSVGKCPVNRFPPTLPQAPPIGLAIPPPPPPPPPSPPPPGAVCYITATLSVTLSGPNPPPPLNGQVCIDAAGVLSALLNANPALQCDSGNVSGTWVNVVGTVDAASDVCSSLTDANAVVSN